MISGFLAVDKPAGWTSHDVVAKVRRLAKQKRIGHAGTLDPPATGLLILGLGKATRLMRYIQSLPKQYLAKVVFGIATDTLDADGAILSREPMAFDEHELRAVMRRFVGVISQVPPMVSAVKVGGRRLYELARQGETVERPSRTVEIYDLGLADFAPGPYPEATLRVRCGSGTYVRSLVGDLGSALGGTAHVTELRRLAIGRFTVEQALTVEDLEAAAESDTFDAKVWPMADGLADLPAVVVDDDTVRGASHGVPFPRVAIPAAPEAGVFTVLDPERRLVAVYRSEVGRLVPEVVVA